MHCLYPEEELPRWFVNESFMNGLNDFEFDAMWKRFDPFLAFCTLRHDHMPFHMGDEYTVPHFKDFLAVESKEAFSSLWGKDDDCKVWYSHNKAMANGFLLIPTLLDHFGIGASMDPAELGFKICLHMKLLLLQRKLSKTNAPVPNNAFKYIYRLLCWIWAVEKGFGCHVYIHDTVPLNEVNEVKTSVHLKQAIRNAKIFVLHNDGVKHE